MRKMPRTILFSAAAALAFAACTADTETGVPPTETTPSPSGSVVTSPPPGLPAVLRATVSWDGSTCVYTGPRSLVAEPMLPAADRQRLRIRFENRSASESVFLVAAGLSSHATYEELLEWAQTHDPNFYGSFPPGRFVVPGSMQIVGTRALQDRAASIGPFDDPGRYYLACLAYPPDELGGTMHPASLLEVTGD